MGSKTIFILFYISAILYIVPAFISIRRSALILKTKKDLFKRIIKCNLTIWAICFTINLLLVLSDYNKYKFFIGGPIDALFWSFIVYLIAKPKVLGKYSDSKARIKPTYHEYENIIRFENAKIKDSLSNQNSATNFGEVSPKA